MSIAILLYSGLEVWAFPLSLCHVLEQDTTSPPRLRTYTPIQREGNSNVVYFYVLQCYGKQN